MSKTREQRVEEALSQLVERTLPFNQNEDEAAADERYDNALDVVKDILDK